MALYNANDIDSLNEFWNFLNRQWSGEFKLGTFVKDVSDAAEAAQATGTASLPLAGGTMTGAIAMGSHKVTGVTDGTAAQDAATVGQTLGVIRHINVVVGNEALAKRIITGSIADKTGAAVAGASNVTLKIYSSILPTVVANGFAGGTAIIQELGVGGSTKFSVHTFQTAEDGTFIIEITAGAAITDMHLELTALEALPCVGYTSFVGP